MKTNYNPPCSSRGATWLLLILPFLFSNCHSFKKGYQKFQSGQPDKAATIFKKKINHPVWGPGAITYLEFIKLRNAHTLLEWQQSDSVLCSVVQKLGTMPFKTRLKLSQYDVNPRHLEGRLANIQSAAMETVRITGNISGLDTLLDHFPCWQREDSLKKFTRETINKTLLGSTDLENDNCYLAFPATRWGIGYDNAARIINRHAALVKPENLEIFWGIQQDIWKIFRSQPAPYCDMDRFRKDFPDHLYVKDCWYDVAKRSLCTDSLKVALSFHIENPHSAFDEDICNRILCLSQRQNATSNLSQPERQRVDDIRLMFDLEVSMCGGEIGDTARFFQNLENLSRKYHDHATMFHLAKMATNFFLRREQPPVAQHLMNRLAPFFTDQSVCPQLDFDFQVAKQLWFRQYRQMLRAPEVAPGKRARAMAAWNTKDHHEFGAISWDVGQEAYFVRQDAYTESNDILYSKWEEEKWSVPAPVRELNFSPDVVPLSITDDGLWMLLRSEGRIWQSTRRKTSLLWSRPEPLFIDLPVATWAALSADGLHLLVEGMSDLSRLQQDIFLCKMGKNGRFGKPEKLKMPVSLSLYNDTHPYLTTDGRLLYFSSDRPGGMGETDNYVMPLSESLQFANPDSSASHLGWYFNTWRDDAGFSFVSNYAGKGFFHRSDLCERNLDIFEVAVPPVPPCDSLKKDSVKCRESFILRFAGVVLDENRKPVPGDEGSFMEFITDYDLHATKRLISRYGTYTYTAPSSAKAVRLFPEIPGYYSERDTTHFPAALSQDIIIRDTFRITSFEHIRKNFVLKYGTFYHETAEFDDKDRVYPEMVRLAKIARRMGAELVIRGHTDSTGTHVDNDKLSKQRANAVKTFLVQTCGFDREKITTVGIGSKEPKCSNASEEGRRCNRRVEVVFKMPELPTRKTPAAKVAAPPNPDTTSSH